MGFVDLTDPQAVRAAVDECDRVGAQQCVHAHGIGPSRRHYLQVNDRLYDVMAITGVAYGSQHPGHGPLRADEFSGGESEANAALRRLGFTVLDARPTTTSGERSWRQAIWRHVRANETRHGMVRPQTLRDVGAFGGAQGIWVDAERTKTVHAGGVAVGVLHTGAHYPDDLDEDGAIYHYPHTRRAGGRDAGEVDAMKTAARLQLPIFVITKPTPSSSWRQARLAWIEGWDDVSETFLITFGEEAPTRITDIDRSDEVPFELEGNRSKHAPGRVRRRPGQRKFQFLVLQRYGPRCPLSGVTVPAMLEAAHLRGDADGGSDDPRNGLPLNAALHRAFDAHLFAVNPHTLKVETQSDGPSFADLGILHPDLYGLKKLPHLEALKWRYQRWKEITAT